MGERPRIKNMKVLIVEDHQGLAELLAEEIVEAGLRARWVSSAEQATPLLSRWGPDLVVSDLRLPGADGLELMSRVKSEPGAPAFLVITAFGTISQAVEALKAGADDFLTKPLDLHHFIHRMTGLLETRWLRRQVESFRQAFEEETFHGIYGKSRPMLTLFEQIKQMATASGPVLIQGESGVGKELVARALHQCSERRDCPFLAVNCAGIPETLMESEFFGHAAGSFTGAREERSGLFREAEGGTLLLDEIAEMPLSLQSKLLRILQDGRVRPVGANREQRVDVRVLAATHQDLEAAMGEGRIREDLFYRLETFTLRVPPLRDRDTDLELLAARFLTIFNARMGKQIQGFSDPALELLRRHSYPGNVRELQNAIERAVTFCHESRIRPEHLPSRLRHPDGKIKPPESFAWSEFFTRPVPPTLAEVEQSYIEHVLTQVEGNKRKAAEILGITRNTLYRRLAQSD